jgi:hypothetical protein
MKNKNFQVAAWPALVENSGEALFLLFPSTEDYSSWLGILGVPFVVPLLPKLTTVMHPGVYEADAVVSTGFPFPFLFDRELIQFLKTPIPDVIKSEDLLARATLLLEGPSRGRSIPPESAWRDLATCAAAFLVAMGQEECTRLVEAATL